jgi:hypothetical protein
MAHVEHEGFARLLAVVDHVEAVRDLLADALAHRGAAFTLDLGFVHGLAARAPCEQPGQRRGPRQAPGMGGQDPVFAALHFSPVADVSSAFAAARCQPAIVMSPVGPCSTRMAALRKHIAGHRRCSRCALAGGWARS